MVKKSWIIIGIVLLLFVIVIMSFVGKYNKIVSKEEVVKEKWSQVENVYQRRADLIDNLVNTVKGYADFERGTLTEVIEARSKATSIEIKGENLNEDNLRKFQEAQGNLSNALSRLMVVVERYPELKAGQNFLELQSQLEGTENRIAVERMRFNEATRDYNTYIRRFPQNIIAGLFGFEKKPYFETEKENYKVPKVKF